MITAETIVFSWLKKYVLEIKWHMQRGREEAQKWYDTARSGVQFSLGLWRSDAWLPGGSCLADRDTATGTALGALWRWMGLSSAFCLLGQRMFLLSNKVVISGCGIAQPGPGFITSISSFLPNVLGLSISRPIFLNLNTLRSSCSLPPPLGLQSLTWFFWPHENDSSAGSGIRGPGCAPQCRRALSSLCPHLITWCPCRPPPKIFFMKSKAPKNT